MRKLLSFLAVLIAAALPALGQTTPAGAGAAAPGSAGTAPPEQTPALAEHKTAALDEAEGMFHEAFSQEMEPTQRVQLLERLIKEHPDSNWVDDALWVLGEAARQQTLPQRVIYYWQYLMGSRPEVELEDFTRTQDIYRASGLPEVLRYLQSTGMSYVPEQGLSKRGETVYFNARPFNPVPMFVWEGCGRAYEDLTKPELALKAYKRALEAAPPSGPWAGRYRDTVERLEKSLKAGRAKAGTVPASQGPIPGSGVSASVTGPHVDAPAGRGENGSTRARQAPQQPFPPAQDGRHSARQSVMGRTSSD